MILNKQCHDTKGKGQIFAYTNTTEAYNFLHVCARIKTRNVINV